MDRPRDRPAERARQLLPCQRAGKVRWNVLTRDVLRNGRERNKGIAKRTHARTHARMHACTHARPFTRWPITESLHGGRAMVVWCRVGTRTVTNVRETQEFVRVSHGVTQLSSRGRERYYNNKRVQSWSAGSAGRRNYTSVASVAANDASCL